VLYFQILNLTTLNGELYIGYTGWILVLLGWFAVVWWFPRREMACAFWLAERDFRAPKCVEIEFRRPIMSSLLVFPENTQGWLKSHPEW
jgi:hypothetical protein